MSTELAKVETALQKCEHIGPLHTHVDAAVITGSQYTEQIKVQVKCLTCQQYVDPETETARKAVLAWMNTKEERAVRFMVQGLRRDNGINKPGRIALGAERASDR